MNKFPIILVLIFSLTPLAKAIRKFKDEYPNVTVCESTLRADSGLYDMPHSYKFLRAHFMGLHKCTHIEGHLIIQNIWKENEILDFSFLEDVEEVSGIVKMVNNSIDSIILPKLKVIRGEDGFDVVWKNNQRHSVSLFLQTNNIKNSAHLILPNLRVISKNSVYFRSETPHPYLPHSIRWTEFFEDEEKQSLLTLMTQNTFYKCHSSCELMNEDTSQTYCWSPLSNHCQQKTNCIEYKDRELKWCYFKKIQNQTIERYCSSTCAGGCSGINNNQCQVCRNFVNGDACVDSCPPEYIKGHNIKNPDFKLRVGMMCSTACPDNLLRQEDACIYKCTVPQFYRINETCIPCNNKDGCNPKECRIEDTCERSDSTSFYMTKNILERLTECEHLIGQIHFSEKSFDKSDGEITVPLLYKHLSNVKTITGDLTIDGSNVILHNLTFLQNLEEIRHLKQKDCFRPGDTALNIFYTDLEFLGLRRLRHIFGQFFEIQNKNLCYLTTLPWIEHILKLNEIRSDMKNCHKTCDAQCGQNGCWGPTSSMCYICNGVRAGYNCVESCEDEPGYYTNHDIASRISFISISYDDGTCKKCNTLCQQNCTGPSETECVGGCRILEENNKCVTNCSNDYYQEGKRCIPCNENCLRFSTVERICSGGGRQLGEGGCASCTDFILMNNTLFCNHHKCLDGYYTDISLNGLSKICKPCTEPCARCRSKLLRKPECTECKKFWNDDLCVNECDSEIPNLFQPNKSGSICQKCDKQCLGCTAPNSDTQCLACRRKSIYTNSKLNLFKCVETCPRSHNYTYTLDEREICMNSTESQEYEYKEHYKKLMKIIFWILVPTFVTFVIASVIIFEIFKKNKKIKSTNYLRAIYSNNHEPDSRVLLFNKENVLAQPNMNRLNLIPTTNILFDINGKPLGTGAFGSVYKGIWKFTNEFSSKKEKNELDVAVKVIQIVNQKEMEDLLEEAKIMASVSHKHCLRLIGISLMQKQPCLVTTYMELGSLDKYLKKHKDTLSSFTLLSWAEQIANGMAYLEMRGIIHRDLATRNVLLNNSQLLQITDFGLSRFLQGTEDNNEIIVTNCQVPVRWLAPETLSSGIYSHKTDVWAYGVTLWEIFTFGERPYEGMKLHEIPKFLNQNNRLSQPEICSLDVYVEMLNCWNESQFRSSFKELMVKFSSFSQHPTYYLNIPNDSCLLNNKCGAYNSGARNSEDNINFDAYKKSLWKSKAQPSLTGTISTYVDDYQDSGSISQMRRQSSNFNNMSSNIEFSEYHESMTPLLFQSLILSETAEEEGEYLEPKKPTFDDHEYLEPTVRFTK